MDSSHLTGINVPDYVFEHVVNKQKESEMKLKRIGIDLAKNVFQLHGVDDHENPVLHRQLKRSQVKIFFTQLPATLVGMEACGSAYYWARELERLGHTVKLIPPQFVKPYVTGNKTDANDAEAICEAVSRPRMRFVTIKTPEQQALQIQQRIRQRLIRARTALVNEIRGALGEFGILFSRLGIAVIQRELPGILEDADNGLCGLMRENLHALWEELGDLNKRIQQLDAKLKLHAKADERIQRLQQIDGVGPVGASAIVAAVGDAKQFKSAREFSAWLGIVPRQHSSGGKDKFQGISKRGDTYLRTLVVHGARAVVQHSKHKTDSRSQWINALVQRRNKNIATVALANKNARIMWAMLTRAENYRAAVN